MTTQTVSVTLLSMGDAVGFTATCTDDTYTELKDSVGTLSLYQACKVGQKFHSFMGLYAAGGGNFRIRNTVTNQIKKLEMLSNGTLQIPFKGGDYIVEMNDVIEAFCVAVPT